MVQSSEITDQINRKHFRLADIYHQKLSLVDQRFNKGLEIRNKNYRDQKFLFKILTFKNRVEIGKSVRNLRIDS